MNLTCFIIVLKRQKFLVHSNPFIIK